MARWRLKLPRNPPLPTRIPPILRTRTSKIDHRGELIRANTPRLWNAKRRIKTSHGLTPRQLLLYRDNRLPTWRQHVSADVLAFIDAQQPPLTPSQLLGLLRNPPLYFSHPHNVPPSSRKQVYFPSFAVTLTRTPHNPPSFATFYVPLWFSKLDLRSYLQNLYGVAVVSIRSFVTPSKIQADMRRGRRFLDRAPSKKKMTVQLVEPFIWPDEVSDFAEWEKEEYWRVGRAQVEMQREEGQWGQHNPDQRHRRAIAQQARDVLEGRTVWRSTWMELPVQRRVLEGVADIPTRQPQAQTASKVAPPVDEFANLRV
ncbi:hypothetical protein DV737_g5168, partial [Chaetothyriales sp. CBS 132003]